MELKKGFGVGRRCIYVSTLSKHSVAAEADVRTHLIDLWDSWMPCGDAANTLEERGEVSLSGG